jgi:hypothetical protein
VYFKMEKSFKFDLPWSMLTTLHTRLYEGSYVKHKNPQNSENLSAKLLDIEGLNLCGKAFVLYSCVLVRRVTRNLLL